LAIWRDILVIVIVVEGGFTPVADGEFKVHDVLIVAVVWKIEVPNLPQGNLPGLKVHPVDAYVVLAVIKIKLVERSREDFELSRI
jgi:hypothetical protein